jgi:hypothetical protein
MLTGLVRPDFTVARGLRFRQSPIRWVEAVAALQLIGLVATAVVAAKVRRGFGWPARLLPLVSLLALCRPRGSRRRSSTTRCLMSGVGALNRPDRVAWCQAASVGCGYRRRWRPPRSVALFALCVTGLRKCGPRSWRRGIRRANQQRFRRSRNTISISTRGTRRPLVR